MRGCRTPFGRSSVRCRAAARHPANVRSGKAMSEQQHVNTVTIKGKPYVAVAERVRLAHAAGGYAMLASESYTLGETGRWWMRVTILVGERQYIGTAEIKLGARAGTADGDSPVECAETSALGRALGFAGFGSVDGIASADEMQRSEPRVMSQSAARRPAPTEPMAPDPQPGDAPTSLAEIATLRASADVQRDLAEQISRAGHKTVGAAEAWLEGVCGRHIGAAALKSGTSSITLGEVKRALGELPPATHPRHERGQLAAI